MVCPKCGKEINQDDVICLNCGTLLTGTYKPTEESKIEPVTAEVQPEVVAEEKKVETIDFGMSNQNVENNDVENTKNEPFKTLDISFVPETVTPETMAAMAMSSENQVAEVPAQPVENVEAQTTVEPGATLVMPVAEVQAEIPVQPVENVETQATVEPVMPVAEVQAEIPVQPIENVEAQAPVEPVVEPVMPVAEVQAEVPVQPVENVEAQAPVEPVVEPVMPVAEVQAEVPVQPVENVEAQAPVEPVVQETPNVNIFGNVEVQPEVQVQPVENVETQTTVEPVVEQTVQEVQPVVSVSDNNLNNQTTNNINYGGMPEPQLNQINNQPNYGNNAMSFTEMSVNPALEGFKQTLSDESVPSVVPENEQPIVETEAQPVKVKKEKTKKELKLGSRKNALYMGLISVAVIAVAIFGIYFYVLKKAPTTYNIGEDRIPSITQVVGKRKLANTTSSNNDDVILKKYEYTKVKSVTTDLYQYMQYLTESLKFVNTKAYDLNETSGTIELGNDSVTQGYVIEISIEYNTDFYVVTVRRAPGSLTRY